MTQQELTEYWKRKVLHEKAHELCDAVQVFVQNSTLENAINLGIALSETKDLLEEQPIHE